MIEKCVAMNRTLTNVLFGGIGSSAAQTDFKIEGAITKTTVDETVEALSNADNVILVRMHVDGRITRMELTFDLHRW